MMGKILLHLLWAIECYSSGAFAQQIPIEGNNSCAEIWRNIWDGIRMGDAQSAESIAALVALEGFRPPGVNSRGDRITYVLSFLDFAANEGASIEALNLYEEIAKAYWDPSLYIAGANNGCFDRERNLEICSPLARLSPYYMNLEELVAATERAIALGAGPACEQELPRMEKVNG